MRLDKYFKIFPLLLIAILFLSACSQAAAPTGSPAPTEIETSAPANTQLPAETMAPTGTSLPAETETQIPSQGGFDLTDGLGRTIALSGPAQRVVSLAPSNTEILFAVGAGPQVVGRDEFSDYPAEAKDLPSVGGSFGEYSLEAVVNLQPDLVLAAEINTPEQVKSLEDLGLTVYYLKNPLDLEGMYANLRTVAALTGHAQEAESLVESLKKRVEAVISKTGDIASRPAVFYELDATDPNAPYTFGPGTFMDMLIRMAGGTNVGGALESAWAQISTEELLVQNPDIILLGDAAYGVTPESIAARPGWAKIKAVIDGRIYTFDDNLVSRPGPRLVDGLEVLAKLFWPDMFQ